MARLQLFDYVVLYHHKTKKDNAGNDITDDSKIVVPAGQMLASSADVVSKKVARLIPADYEDELGQCEIIVRPF